MHSAQCRVSKNTATPVVSGGGYIGGGYVMTSPTPTPPRLSDLHLVLQITPACHWLSSNTLWLRMKCEGRGLTKPQVLSLLRQLWMMDYVEYDERQGWRKAGGEGARD